MTDLSALAAKVPVRLGQFIETMEIVKGALADHSQRLTALDGGVTKAAKPRVRVQAKSYFTPEWGGTYETTDGITYRLVRP